MNVPGTIARVLASKQATLHELQTIYGLVDLFDMLEVILVEQHNEGVASRANSH